MINIQLHKAFKGSKIPFIIELELDFKTGEFITLFGPSGAGKTTALKLISGLIEPDKGELRFDDVVWYDAHKKLFVPPQKRSVNMVFQDYALFPNMTVISNLKFALRKTNMSYSIEELIQIFELGNVLDHHPDELSGGQQQRVALARALVNQPKLLLLDEPFSSLDSRLRLKLKEYLKEVHKRFDLTIIMVSHDIDQAKELSDRIFFMENGRVVKEELRSDFRNANNATSELEGKFIGIEETQTGKLGLIQIGNSIIRIPYKDDELRFFNPGDIVKVSVAIQGRIPRVENSFEESNTEA